MKSESRGNIIIVDDEPNALKILHAILTDEGYKVTQASSAELATKYLHAGFDAVISDLKMPGMDGIQLFNHISSDYPDIPVIFLTAYGTVDSAVKAMTDGAYYYFVKPPDYNSLKNILSRAVEHRRLKRELEILKRSLSEKEKIPAVIGKNKKLTQVLQTIESVKNSQSSILITGDTGTGKEMIARALHFQSDRRSKPFMAVNCAAIPANLIESELFGYEKGAFTGATAKRIGKIEEASGGTLFLDEIGELELAVQAKLLRVLQEREVERLGANQKYKVDFRLVSSTNRNLLQGIEDGHFREDLFYRINVVQIELPPLHERKDDIPLLVSEFLKEFCLRENKILNISPDVMAIFQSYAWPGNIRQLRNVIERAVVLSRGQEITPKGLPEEIFADERNISKLQPLKSLKEREAETVREVMERCNGNKSMAARILGCSRKALYKKLRDFQVV